MGCLWITGLAILLQYSGKRRAFVLGVTLSSSSGDKLLLQALIA